MHGGFLYSLWRTMWFSRENFLWLCIFVKNSNQQPDPRNYVPTNVPIFMNRRTLGPMKINDFTVILPQGVWKCNNQNWSRPNGTNTPAATNSNSYFTQKSRGGHPQLIGSLRVKFHDEMCKEKAITRIKQSVINALWPWPFDPEINRVHRRLMGSLCVHFHDDRCKRKELCAINHFQ